MTAAVVFTPAGISTGNDDMTETTAVCPALEAAEAAAFMKAWVV
jgi:hypothetical protein